ncbi:MAG: hypothetical protein IJX14_08415 [Clostridia bacterium]|nr:hypothetical protein [Clostridia bacterium]
MKIKSILTTILALTMSLTVLTGCGSKADDTVPGTELSSGGVLILRVNPEIAVEYDDKGIVTGVTARNDDAMAILAACGGIIGKETCDAVTVLVNAIGEAGYFVEEVEGEKRQITIEIEAGSILPAEDFLDEVITYVRLCVENNDWNAPLFLENATDYGVIDYAATDYGVNSDGITDYNDGVTDYNDTDYGPNNDGVTDYNDTDYGPNNDGVTDYNDTDYGPNNDGVTDYNDTDYGPNNDGVTDYNDTDYGPNNDGVTDYNSFSGISDYFGGNSNYGSSNYGGSNYGGSDYDD